MDAPWDFSFITGLIWELLPAFIISFAAIIIVSLLSEPPGRDVEAEFELAAATHLPLRDEQGNPIPIMEFELVRDIMERPSGKASE